jgi:class 3 adenylate cyclase
MINSHRRQSNMPEDLANKLQAAKASQRMRGERRVITMLFCDVTGSTSMAEQLDPEEWAEIMNEAFDYLIRPIYRYEGTLARMMGDGILAFFGAPIAHEDDPQRAIRAGLDIVEGLEPFRNEISEDYDLDFNVRE